MNREILRQFKSPENVNYIIDVLHRRYPGKLAFDLVMSKLHNTMEQFIHELEIELYGSDSIQHDLKTILNYYDNRFIARICKLIQTNQYDGIPEPEHIFAYRLHDGIATHRTNYNDTADNLLAKWSNKNTRGLTIREDTMAEEYNPTYNVLPDAPLLPLKKREGFDDRRKESLKSPIRQEGIIFADTDRFGYNRYHDQFYTDTMNYHNREVLPPFGVGDDRESDRMLNMTRERNPWGDKYSSIPLYRRRLHRRYMDPDISESLPGRERESMVSGYDMSKLYARINKNIKNRNKC